MQKISKTVHSMKFELHSGFFMIFVEEDFIKFMYELLNNRLN